MKLKERKSSTETNKRVFLVDQFSTMRKTVADRLKHTPNMAVCGEAANAALALKAIGELKPDIVVTEIVGPPRLKFIQTLHEQFPRLPILVFSFRDEGRYAPRALEAGADGYLPKSVTVDNLMEGIQGALEGRLVLSASMRYRLLRKCMRNKATPAVARRMRGRECFNPGSEIGRGGFRKPADIKRNR